MGGINEENGNDFIIARKDNEVLLGKKKRGFGCGKYNGVGGKLELGETPEEAMIRETKEEIDVTPTKYKKVGIVEFKEFLNDEKTNLIFHLYIGTEWIGNPTESDEIEPFWFNINNIPYDNMFLDDTYWLPLVLAGKKIKAFFDFDENWNILSYKIEELDAKFDN